MDKIIECTEYLEGSDTNVTLSIDMQNDCAYLEFIDFPVGNWLTEKEINQIIKLLQNAKRIKKTGIVL